MAATAARAGEVTAEKGVAAAGEVMAVAKAVSVEALLQPAASGGKAVLVMVLLQQAASVARVASAGSVAVRAR
jgi:hypothetical protein